jgi:hypothetical protein
MKKQYFKNFRKEGLPGGPNELIINSEGFILSENGQWEFPGLPTVIPSSDITMEDVPYPVLGISDTGDTQMMYPEEDYQFDGDMVYELPMAQKGYNVKPRKGSILLEGETEPSTHLMRREYIPNTGWVAFPSLFQNEDGTWVDMSKEEDWMNIYDEANRRGEVYNFGENKRKAIKFADKGSWKKDLGIKKQGGGDISIPDLTKPNWLDTLPKQYAGGGDLPPMEVNIGLPKYGKKRVLNLKDYTKHNTTSNRFPVVQNPFLRENKINLHLPENHGEEHRRLEGNPYFGGVNVEPDLNVYYGGVDADLNLLNKNNNILDLRGGLNTGLVTYPGGSEFTGVNPSVGLSYSHKFAKGGWLNELPKAQKGKMLNKERQQLLKEKEFEDFLKKSSVDEQGTLTYVLPEYTVKSPEKKLYDEAFQDALNKQKSFQNKWYPGDISEGVLDNMKQRASVIANDKVAKDILDNNKIKDLKGYQKEYIANSNYSGKLRPGIFQEFGEGVQDLGRITQGKLPTTKALGILSPLEYPVNLVRGTVKGEGLDALKGKISSPWIDASKVDIGAVNDVGAYNTIYNIGMDPLNLTGMGLTGAADDALRGISKGSKYFKTNKIVTTPKQLPGSGNVNPLVNTAPTPWTMQEMPGLHLKSTMSDGAVSKIVEPKTGLVNVEQALGIIGKESGGADKVALIKQGLGETLPKKMDYNEFRKVVQDQLIPLERQFATRSSKYGIEHLGFVPKVQGNPFERFRTVMNTGVSDFNKPRLLENQTLILGNKNKFGRGSNAHGNPDETLGHIHFLRDAESPDVLTVTQIQSDAFQGTHRVMPKVFNKEQELRGLSMMEDKLKARELDYSKAKKLPNGDYKFDDGLIMDKTLYEQGLTVQKEMNAMKKADIESYTQKSLLDKNHQERYLQELVDYAGKRGDINKIRVPTSETAAKVQGYRETSLTGDNAPGFGKLQEEISIAVRQGDQQKVNDLMKVHDEMLKTPYKTYSSDQKTILKKYSEQPKVIKKVFGVEPKIVTDSKGNTWYEFDIPEKFKKGTAEIKAFSIGGMITPPAAIIGAGALQQNKKSKGGWLDNLPEAQKGNTGKQSANESWGLTQESQLSDLTKGLLNNILHRQAFAESSFNPKVISGDKTSRVGALGMTQIMPETLNEYINKTGDKNINILDPKDAVKVQKWYMQDLLNADFIHKPNQSEKVRMVKALGSYNWGRGNMSKFLGKQKKKGVDIYSDELSWVNDLPVETRDYVNKIVLGTNEKFNQEYKQNSSKYKDYYQKGGWLDKL